MWGGIPDPDEIPEASFGVGWYRSTAYSQANGSDIVTAWTDRFPSGNDMATIGGTPTFETNVINGLPVIEFVNTEHIFVSGTGNLSQPSTVLLVARRTVAAGANELFTGSGAAAPAGKNTIIHQLGGRMDVSANALNFPRAESTTNTVDNSFFYVVAVYDDNPDGNNNGQIRFNGTLEGGPTDIGVLNMTDWGLMQRSGGSSTHQIAELIVYNALLSLGSILFLEQYARDRYAL